MSSAPNLAREVNSRRKSGLGHWMSRVLKEADKAVPDLDPDPVHDLRVALRRCRSMADGLGVIDADKSWKKMKKLGKPLFQALGELRDVQVMKDWIEQLGSAEDDATRILRTHTETQEAQLKQQALQALEQFDRAQWKTWRRELARRAARIRLGSPVFQHLALERWMEARKLQPPALRTGNPQSLHRLRIGLKRFRYTVENFLPQLDARWSDGLKQVQDLLGEVHDLDVLWQTALAIGAFPDEASRARWHDIITVERQKRIEKYREKMAGPHALWNVWRDQLPKGRQIHAAALSRLKTWASFLDPDFRHAQRVAQLATRFYDELTRKAIDPVSGPQDLRSILYAAALMHEVGRSRKRKDHHKKSSHLIRSLRPPLGWTAEELNLAGIVARYHRGALPQSRHHAFGRLPSDQRRTALRLAAILRFVDAIAETDARRPLDHRAMHLQVEEKDRVLQVYAAGYRPYSQVAVRIAAARHLLEVNLRRPVVVKALIAKKHPLRQSKTKRAKPAA
ncbi:MAG TPA: CHAD domain-containing protein [Terriglobales bacterium]|nr:CHAD domain-containing protein [Terriglobales bacterium]